MAINFDSDTNQVNITVPSPITVTVSEKGRKGDTGDTGPTGPEGPQGVQGIQGLVGPGVPAGGVADQIIVKQSDTDYDTDWDYIQTLTESVKNVTAGTLVKGTPVHVTGSTGNTVEVIAADATTNYPAHFILNEDLAPEAEGRGIAIGFINNVDVPNASIYTEGQTVYLGASGGWVTTKPTGTNAIQNLGVIVKVNTSGNKISGIVLGAGRANDVPNLPSGKFFIGSATNTAESAYTMPTADGSSNQVLSTDGSGAVAFVTPSTSNVTEGSNLYYTEARVAANSAVAANTAKTSFPGFGTTAGTALEGDTALFDGQYSSLTGVPSTFAPSAHTHTASEITDFDTEVSNNTSVAANTAKVSFPGFGTTAGTALEGDTALFDGDYTSLSNIPSTFTPSAHTHTASEITDFDTEVSNNTSVAANTAKVGYTDAAVDLRIAAASIEDLSDVPTLGTAGQVLAVNAGATALEYVAQTGGGATSIDDLSDVDTSTVAPTDGQALVWDNTNSKWEPGTVSGGGSSQWTTSGSDIYYTTGNVGVGTTTPSESFSVQGQLQLEDSSGSGNILVNAGTSAITTGTNHIAIGNGTGQYVISGSNGVAIGNGASAGGVSNHIAIGPSSGRTSSLTSGYGDLVSIGRNAGRGNAWIVQDAIAIGYNAMGSSNGGVSSIAMGRESLYQTQFQDGDHIALGMRAMRVSNGNNNIAIGREAMSSITGSHNVAIGYRSGGLYNNGRSYSDNVAIGAYSGHHNNGGLNVLVGRDAGLGVAGTSTFANTVAVGYQALTALTTGAQNTAVGYQAGDAITSSTGNTLVGYQAGTAITGSSNAILGNSAGTSLTSGTGNVLVGSYAGGSMNTNINTTVIGNGANAVGATNYGVAIGASSKTNTGGVAVGYQALAALTTGTGNTAVGYQAGSTLTSNNNNTLFGYQAKAGGSDNVAMGREAMATVSGDTRKNISIGSFAGIRNGASVGNIFLGYQAGKDGRGENNFFAGDTAGATNIGSNNIGIGGQTGRLGSGSSNVWLGQGIGYNSSVSNSTIIGYDAKEAENSVAVGFQAGNSSSASSVFVGYQAGSAETNSNRLYIENSNSTTPLIYGEFDNDILRVNGTLQVNDPSSTGYAFPTATGTLGQVLEVDANGDLVFATPSGGGGGTPLASADQTLTADRTIDTNGFNLDIELDSTGTPDTFTIHDGTHDLFQVDTGISGTIFSVNDVSGLPKLTVDDSDGVTIDKFKEVKYEKPSNTDFSYQGDVVYFGATTGMTQGDLYYFNSSGNWAQADADAVSSSGSVLLAIALGTASDTNGMLLKGTFTMAAGAIDGTEATGDELYVSTTAGHVTSAAPTATGDVVRVIGYCLDGTNGQIWFNPSNDWIELS